MHINLYKVYSIDSGMFYKGVNTNQHLSTNNSVQIRLHTCGSVWTLLFPQHCAPTWRSTDSFFSIRPFVFFFFAHRTSPFVSLLSVSACLCAGSCASTPGQGIFLLSIQHWFPVWLHQTNTRFAFFYTCAHSPSLSLCLCLLLSHSDTHMHTQRCP